MENGISPAEEKRTEINGLGCTVCRLPNRIKISLQSQERMIYYARLEPVFGNRITPTVT